MWYVFWGIIKHQGLHRKCKYELKAMKAMTVEQAMSYFTTVFFPKLH